MKRKDDLRDIYQSTNPDFEKDFTPQVAQELIEERQRDLARSRVTSLLFGGLALVLGVTILALVIRDFMNSNRTLEKPVRTEDRAFIPRYSLPTEAAWVIDYQQAVDQGDPETGSGEKPLSTKWVKKAAYHIIMGQQALAMDEKEEALKHFAEVVAIYPEIEGLHRTMGMLSVQEENYELAAKHLEMALEEEELFDVVNNLGTAYIGLEDYEKASKHLTRALELQPESPVCHKNLGVLYQKMGREKEAIFHFEKYLDLRPDDLESMQTYALYLTKLGRWKEAATFLEELTKDVTDVAPIYFLLAQVQVQNGRPEAAVAALQRGIQLVDPTLALAWMSRNEFDSVRESENFRRLIDQLEIASVSLDDGQ
jgi:tetratricopeptide (TPR) repeat protein